MKSKGKVFAFMDHQSASMEVALVQEHFRKWNSSESTFTVPQRAKVLRELLLQKIQKIADLPGMESFEAVDRDRLPKAYHTFQSFVNQSVTIEASKSKDILVTWNAPIQIKMILLPDVIM